jgi:hypothetical protein
VHEQTVAINSLGLLTAVYARSREKRRVSSRLGVKLATLPMTQQEDDRLVPIVSSTSLPKSEAALLSTALRVFTADTPVALSVYVTMNTPHLANVRAAEDDVAHTMLEELATEFAIAVPPFRLPPGFR